MDVSGAFLKFAAEHGYEVVHGQQSWGDNLFGLFVLVKMSNRKYDRERDWLGVNRAVEAMKTSLDTVSAEVDPNRDKKREQLRDRYAAIYREAGIEAVYMEALPNGYCSKPCCLNSPWFRVTSRIGHIVIGWRKSVISIDWKDSIVKKSGEELFPHEDVTRWETGIHAHGEKKAAEYIRRLHDCVR